MIEINTDNYIKVWKFCDAPEEFRRLSPHGGDEDWLALVPVYMKDEYIPWIGGVYFGEASRHELTDGRVVYIGAHA